MIDVSQAFQYFRQMAGLPTARCIQSVDNWTAPAGYSYSNVHKAFFNSSDEQWIPDTDDLPADTVDILPEAGDDVQAMEMAGIITRGDRVFNVLPDAVVTIRDAWAIEIDSDLFKLANVTPVQHGVSAAAWYRVVATRK